MMIIIGLNQLKAIWKAVYNLLEGKLYLQSLFFTHLVIEKLSKAIWIRDNTENIPPKTHNIIYILSKTQLNLSDDFLEFLLNLNRFQLEGRYPDYLNKMHSICDKIFTESIINRTKQVREWLLEKLQ